AATPPSAARRPEDHGGEHRRARAPPRPQAGRVRGANPRARPDPSVWDEDPAETGAAILPSAGYPATPQDRLHAAHRLVVSRTPEIAGRGACAGSGGEVARVFQQSEHGEICAGTLRRRPGPAEAALGAGELRIVVPATRPVTDQAARLDLD